MTTTPRRLRIFLALILVGAAMMLGIGELTLNRARVALKTVGKDAAPSIVAAQEVRAVLADLDANLANSLLLATPDEQDIAAQLFEYRRSSATRRIIDASQNITYAGEKVAIVEIVENLGRYLQIAARVRMLREKGDVAGALDQYRVATDLMEGRIRPAAIALDKINKDEMNAIYSSQRDASTGAEAIALLIGGALSFVLLWAQLFSLRRFRRLINPALLAASVLTIAFTGYLVGIFMEARDDLHIAKEDSFESIHLLWQIRATAYEANGDESRWLLFDGNKERRAHYEAAFQRRVAELTDHPTFSEEGEIAAKRAKVSSKGLMAGEYDNITFVGERDAALAMGRALAKYYAIDRQIRELEGKGQHAAAVKLTIGSNEGESNWAFDRLDAAVHRTLVINKDVFDQVIADGDRALRRAETWDPALAIAIAILGWLGLRGRLKEYR